MQSSIISLKNQGLIHSRISEGNFRELLNNQRFNCTNSFSTATIGSSIDKIKNKSDIVVWDQSVNGGLFQNNFLIADIKTREKEDSAGDPTPGYAEMIVSFSRPSSLFEKKDQSSACNADDQTGCYQLECLVKLDSSHTGADGVAVGDCELETCTGGFGGAGSMGCLSMNVGNDILTMGCGTTGENTAEGTLAYGINAGSGDNTGVYNTFIGHSSGQNNTSGAYNVFMGEQSGRENTGGRYNIFLGNRAGFGNTVGAKLDADGEVIRNNGIPVIRRHPHYELS